LALALPATAAPVKFFVAPYFTGIFYSGSDVKDTGANFALYGSASINYGEHVVEGLYGYTRIKFKGNASNWNENDYAVAYTGYGLYPLYFRLGAYYIATDNDHYSDGGKVFFGDVGLVQKFKYDFGTFVSYSDYRRGVAALQLRPHAGFYRWKDFYSGFYFGADLTYINVKNPQNIGITKKNYYSAGASVTYFTGYYSITASGWVGERTLMVDKGGFVVYNLEEKYKGGVALEGKLFYKKNLTFGLSAGYQLYKEISTKNDVGVFSITASIGYSF